MMLILYLTYRPTFPGFILRGPPGRGDPAGAVSYQQFSQEHERHAPARYRN